MQYLDRREMIRHRTGDLPLAYYPVDEHFARYRMQLHWHRETELIYVRRGSINLVLDGAEIAASEGDLILVGGGAIHGGEPKMCKYDCIVFDGEALLPPIQSCRDDALYVTRRNLHIKNGMILADPIMKGAIDHLYRVCESGIAGAETELLGALFTLIALGHRYVPQDGPNAQADFQWRRSEQIKPALEYIEQNFREHISLDTLASLTGFSPKYFCRYFRAIVHRSPIDYLNYYRVECAAQYLARGDMNVAEVAVLCGYADSSAFIKQFRKYKNTTPKQYGMQCRKI